MPKEKINLKPFLMLAAAKQKAQESTSTAKKPAPMKGPSPQKGKR